MRRFGVLCASAVLLLATAACGDDDSGDDSKAGDPATPSSTESSPSPDISESPTETPSESESPSIDPEKQEFCTAATAEGFETGGLPEIKGWAEGLRAVTPPSDLTSEGSQGMELILTTVEDAKKEADITEATGAFNAEQQAAVKSFLTYIQTNCQ